MRTISIFLLLSLIHGCAAYIDHSAGRFKNVFKSGTSKIEIVDSIGEAEYSYTKGINTKPPIYSIDSFHSYDVFNVTGKIHKPGDGAAQATASAVTLGIAELVLIPTTIVKVAGEYTDSHTLVVFYDSQGRYLAHQLFDDRGMRESISSY